MAGSYYLCVADDGQLLRPGELQEMLDNVWDAYETIVEMYGMIWYLADGHEDLVEEAQEFYLTGCAGSPGLNGALPH